MLSARARALASPASAGGTSAADSDRAWRGQAQGPGLVGGGARGPRSSASAALRRAADGAGCGGDWRRCVERCARRPLSRLRFAGEVQRLFREEFTDGSRLDGKATAGWTLAGSVMTRVGRVAGSAGRTGRGSLKTCEPGSQQNRGVALGRKKKSIWFDRSRTVDVTMATIRQYHLTIIPNTP